MACLWSDGFDGYATTADAQSRYTAGSINQIITSTSFGVGQAIAVNAAVGLQANFETGTNETTVYGSMRVKYPSGSSSGSVLSLTLQDATSDQVTIQWLDTGTVQVRSGGIAGTVLGSVPSMVALNTWDSWQFKVVIADSAGSVEVQKNGGTSVLALTNVDTRAGVNTSCTRFTIGATALWQLDDLYLNSSTGTAPVTWPGDVRIIYMPVNTTIQQQLLNNQPLATLTPFSAASTITTASGTSRYTPFVASFSGTIGGVTVSMAAAGSGHMRAAFYGNPATTPLATSNEMTNPAAGTLTFTFPTPLTVTKGQSLYFALNQDFAASYSVSSTGGQTSSTTYSVFPPTNPTLSASNAVACTISITTNNNADFVATADGDISTVYSAIAGQKDIYGVVGMGALAPSSIIGVRVMTEWRKSDAGVRAGTVGVNANNSGDVAQINNVTPSLTYSYATKYMPTDPTGAVWTVANVNSMRISLAVSS